MEIQTLLLLTAATFGFINLSKFLLRILLSIWTVFIRPEKDLKSYGSWAAVTGSTDGIGKGLAFELAARGLNLVLIGRNASKLDETSREIRRRHGGVSVRTVVIDFSGGCRGEEIVRAVEGAIRGLDLGILIHNAGMAYPYARFLHEVEEGLMESVVGVNVTAATWVTRAAVAGMMERKRGAIVNVGSGSSACVSSYPLYTVYAATKAYVAMLSKSMSLEYKRHGIDVQCQIPLLVATKMSSIKKASLFIPSPESYSRASMRWIGHSNPICIPYWPHALQAFIISSSHTTLLIASSLDISSGCAPDAGGRTGRDLSTKVRSSSTPQSSILDKFFLDFSLASELLIGHFYIVFGHVTEGKFMF